jgi:hypothetical protein
MLEIILDEDDILDEGDYFDDYYEDSYFDEDY